MNGWILFFVCGLIDDIARKTKNKRADIVNIVTILTGYAKIL